MLLRSDGIENGHREVLEWNAALEAQNHELRNRLVAAEAQVAEERRSAAEAHNGTEAERRAAEAGLRAERDLMLGSTSWRLTEPLRRLGTGLRRRGDR